MIDVESIKDWTKIELEFTSEDLEQAKLLRFYNYKIKNTSISNLFKPSDSEIRAVLDPSELQVVESIEALSSQKQDLYSFLSEECLDKEKIKDKERFDKRKELYNALKQVNSDKRICVDCGKKLEEEEMDQVYCYSCRFLRSESMRSTRR